MKNNTAHIGRHTFCVPEIGSTNTELLSNANRYPQGSVLQALKQTAGKGRRDRYWHSQEGGLYFSFLLKDVQSVRAIYPLILVSAYSVLNTLEKYSTEKRFFIKWPNDVYFQESKICGILAESSTQGSVSNVVIGIGINVNNTVKDVKNLRNPAVSLKDIVSVPVDTGRVLDTFLSVFNVHYDKFLARGLEVFLPGLNAHLYAKGRPVLLTTQNIERTVIPLSFTENGDLLCNMNGVRKILHFGELE